MSQKSEIRNQIVTGSEHATQTQTGFLGETVHQGMRAAVTSARLSNAWLVVASLRRRASAGARSVENACIFESSEWSDLKSIGVLNHIRRNANLY